MNHSVSDEAHKPSYAWVRIRDEMKDKVYLNDIRTGRIQIQWNIACRHFNWCYFLFVFLFVFVFQLATELQECVCLLIEVKHLLNPSKCLLFSFCFFLCLTCIIVALTNLQRRNSITLLYVLLWVRWQELNERYSCVVKRTDCNHVVRSSKLKCQYFFFYITKI